MEVGVSRLFLSVEMFIHRRYNRRRENENEGAKYDTLNAADTVSFSNDYTQHRQFFNDRASEVIAFCNERGISYHIKDGTITE